MVPHMKRILQFAYAPVVRGWFVEEIPTAINRLIDTYGTRNEVLGGGSGAAASDEVGAVTSSRIGFDLSSMDTMLRGRLMDATGTLSNTDLLTKAASVGQPIFADGADASALDLSTDETAYCTLVVTNSDGAGGADEADDGTPVFVLVIAGTSSTYADQSDHLDSYQIKLALAASSGIHDGTTGWQHVCRFVFDENDGSPQLSDVVSNRNNILGV
jgi:hypothetical protein